MKNSIWFGVGLFVVVGLVGCGGGGGGTNSTPASVNSVATSRSSSSVASSSSIAASIISSASTNSSVSTSSSSEPALSLVAGNPYQTSYGSEDGFGTLAGFKYPSHIAKDSNGNFYVSDSGNHTIRKISPAGEVTTFAGKAGSMGYQDGNGKTAIFSSPKGLAVDSSNNVFVVDGGNNIIRKITPSGTVSTFAGLANNAGSIDGTGSQARFFNPVGLAIDTNQNLYVVDSDNHTIRKITPAGVVSTFAGMAGTPGSLDGTSGSARFNYPKHITINPAGDFYVTDFGNRTIRKITASGAVTKFAGVTGQNGFSNGSVDVAIFYGPQGITTDASGNVYVTELNLVRKISDGQVTTLTGDSDANGYLDGTLANARFYRPVGMVSDNSGAIYVVDLDNNSIRKISGNTVSTFAGRGASTGFADGPGVSARFNNPTGLVADSQHNLYIADYNNHLIRKITAQGEVSTLAGSLGVMGSTDGEGVAARFKFPAGIAIDSIDNLYVTDSGNNTIRKITPSGNVTTIAGLAGNSGNQNANGADARFTNPYGIELDTSGNIYVTEWLSGLIRKITPQGDVTNYAGVYGAFGAVDGEASQATFRSPADIAIDLAGNLYIADYSNSNIRKITPAGVVSTIAGSATTMGSTDGTGVAALFTNPYGISIDSEGNLYVSDFSGNTIRKINTATMVTTIVGKPGEQGYDLSQSPAIISSPQGISVRDNQLYFTSAGGVLKFKLSN